MAHDSSIQNNCIKENADGKRPWPLRVWRFYVDGFRNMTVGRYLWALIILKLIIFFLVFKLFFFPDVLASSYDNDEDRAEAVREQLTGERHPVPNGE